MDQFMIATDRLKTRNAILAEMQLGKKSIISDGDIRRLMLGNILQALRELFQDDVEYNEVLYRKTTGIVLNKSLDLFLDLSRIFESADTKTERLFDELLSDAHGVCLRAKRQVSTKIDTPASQTDHFGNIVLRDLDNIIDKIMYILEVNIGDIKKNMPF